MPVHNANFGKVVFLLELELNCSLFKQAFAALEIAAQDRIRLEKGVDDERATRHSICLAVGSVFYGVHNRAHF